MTSCVALAEADDNSTAAEVTLESYSATSVAAWECANKNMKTDLHSGSRQPLTSEGGRLVLPERLAETFVTMLCACASYSRIHIISFA